MSDETLALLITVAVIALLFAWPAFLNFVCPPCGRALAKYRGQKMDPLDSEDQTSSIGLSDPVL